MPPLQSHNGHDVFFLRDDLTDFPGDMRLIRPLRLKFGSSGLLSPWHAAPSLNLEPDVRVYADALLCGADPNELWELR